jgi:hypothetical protein
MEAEEERDGLTITTTSLRLAQGHHGGSCHRQWEQGSRDKRKKVEDWPASLDLKLFLICGKKLKGRFFKSNQFSLASSSARGILQSRIDGQMPVEPASE